MTEHEYICMTNRVKVSTAKRLIADCTTGDGMGISTAQRNKIYEIMSTIESRLFKTIEEMME
jgi:hypothetical protein